MTRNEAARINHQEAVLLSLGFTVQEAESLRRISMTLHRWSEHECNGAIQRDGDHGDGLPFWFNTETGRKICRVPDRERGAIKRLHAMIDARNDRSAGTSVKAYVQGDPRGCALYILRPGDVPTGQDESAYYSRGIAVA